MGIIVVKTYFIVTALISFVGSSAIGQFNVLHCPDSLHFVPSSHSMILESMLRDVFSACLGISVDENVDWHGLDIVKPFQTPEALVQICVEGVPSIMTVPGVITFPLTVDENEPNAYETVKRRIKKTFTSGNNTLMDLKLSNPKELTTPANVKVFGVVEVSNITENLRHLKYTVKHDSNFLNELAMLKSITKITSQHRSRDLYYYVISGISNSADLQISSGVIKPDKVIDFYNFRFRSLLDLSDFHGLFSEEVKEAEILLDEVLQQLSAAFAKVYEGSVLVAVVVIDGPHTRSRVVRSNQRYFSRRNVLLNQGSARTDKRKYSMAMLVDYRSSTKEAKIFRASTTATTNRRKDRKASDGFDYRNVRRNAAGNNTTNSTTFNPDAIVIFHIFLWFGVAFTFVMIAIVYAMMDMDPGRDSIIYRTTNIRMKKDL